MLMFMMTLYSARPGYQVHQHLSTHSIFSVICRV